MKLGETSRLNVAGHKGYGPQGFPAWGYLLSHAVIFFCNVAYIFAFLCCCNYAFNLLIFIVHCVQKKNTHSQFRSYLHEWCVDLNKNCSKYTQGTVDSNNLEIRYSLRLMTYYDVISVWLMLEWVYSMRYPRSPGYPFCEYMYLLVHRCGWTTYLVEFKTMTKHTQQQSTIPTTQLQLLLVVNADIHCVLKKTPTHIFFHISTFAPLSTQQLEAFLISHGAMPSLVQRTGGDHIMSVILRGWRLYSR